MLVNCPIDAPTRPDSTRHIEKMLSILFILSFLTIGLEAGFGPPPGKSLYESLYGPPCDCRGGTFSTPPTHYSQKIDCEDKNAYLQYSVTSTGISRQSWQCVMKPKVIPQNNGSPGPCPDDCEYRQALHSLCYSTTQQCTGKNQQVHLTTKIEKEYAGTFGGETSASVLGTSNKYAQASCGKELLGRSACWSIHAPIHVSDGGGPTDQIREME